jgi:hypothetical protein
MLAENVVQQAVFNKNVGSESSPTGASAKSLEKYAASAEATLVRNGRDLVTRSSVDRDWAVTTATGRPRPSLT